MKIFFKQLFCRHDYHWTHNIFIRSSPVGLSKFKSHYICPKCKKEMITEEF
jgi:hypothetical protein